MAQVGRAVQHIVKGELSQEEWHGVDWKLAADRGATLTSP
jgi:hypothetical protein